MIYPFTRPEIAPRFTVDETSGEGGEDFIECALLNDDRRLEYSVDLWRVSTGGKVTLVRPYWEDSTSFNQRLRLNPGSWLSPNYQARALAEFVRHAQSFAEKFDMPVTVTFLCEWSGLAGRTIYDPESYYSIGGSASVNSRRVTLEVPASSLTNSWPDIVTQLLAPVLRIFNASFQVTPDWVKSRAPTWLKD
jgi:hypothetical protein